MTTYNKFILLLFFITNKFDGMKYNISRVIVRTFENPISIILHVYNIDIQNVSFHVILCFFYGCLKPTQFIKVVLRSVVF